MGLSITNCVVTNSGGNVLTNPTSAELNDDMKPTMHIIISGGNRAPPLMKNALYKITGSVSGNNRNFLNMKCVNKDDPAKFDKS